MLKRTIIACLILILAVQIRTFAQEPNFRVITYNIMDGFNWGKDTARFIHTANWLKEQHPDIVALQELCGYTPERLSIEAAHWGHKYSALLKTSAYSVGLTANTPITVIERKTEGYAHGMLHCRVNGVDVFVVHLSPDDVNYRRREADSILQSFYQTSTFNKNSIVLGDFNANSPYDDDLNRTRPLLLERDIIDDDKSPIYKNLADHYFDYSVVGKFIAAQLVDVCQKFMEPDLRYSYSTPILIPRYRKNMDEVAKRRQRLDYIFVSPAMAKYCTKATIANGTETSYLSDHYPVIADFELNR